MPEVPRVVGIVAGGGSLPGEIAAHVKAGGGDVHIVAIEGEGDRDLSAYPLTRVGWAQIGRMLRALRRAGTTELVIVGSVRRPDLAAIRPDLGFFLNLPAIARIVASGGDDGVLSRVVRFFERQGFKVVSPADVAPSLLVGEGPLGAVRADAHDMADIARGFDLVRALGPFDVGQAVVVADGRIEVIEGAENTDAMLERLAVQRQLAGGGGGGQRRGVLIKRPKPRQEMRVDMPAIGPGTVARALAAGLRGIAVLAKGAIALERAELIRSADAGGLFVKGAVDRGLAVAPAPAPAAFQRLGRVPAGARQRADAARGAALLNAAKPFRDSAGTVVDRGHVLAIECGEGIAALIARAGSLRQWGRRGAHRRTAVAVVAEAAAADLASVVSAAAAAHLAGVAVVGRPASGLAHGRSAADRHGLFLLAPAGGGA
jgi:DUF1009 family protein